VDVAPFRDFAPIFHFHLANCASRRCARRSTAYSDRAKRLNPNIVFSSRDSYQRRGHLTVSNVGSYRLTLPRTSKLVIRHLARRARIPNLIHMQVVSAFRRCSCFVGGRDVKWRQWRKLKSKKNQPVVVEPATSEMLSNFDSIRSTVILPIRFSTPYPPVTYSRVPNKISRKSRAKQYADPSSDRLTTKPMVV